MRLIALAALAAVLPVEAAAQAAPPANRWAPPKCDLRPGHKLVNSGMMFLKSATETRFDDQRQKDLQEANGALTQAVTTGDQAKNPAAWYYLARYYLIVKDLKGADTAFTLAEGLKPDCKGDIAIWRRDAWRDAANAGIQAWQANNNDSAISSFRRANAIWRDDPTVFKYLATLLYQAGQPDSAIFYFRRAADVAAKDTSGLQDRKDALYNMARIEHSLARAEQDSLSRIKPDNFSSRWAGVLAGYREYLTLVPHDIEILASIGSVKLTLGQRDSAFAIYRQIIAGGDSGSGISIFRAGVEMYQGAPEPPDTAAAGRVCRGRARPVPPARSRACRDSLAAVVRVHDSITTATYRLAAEAFDAGLKLNPYFRDGLFNAVAAHSNINDTAAILPLARRLLSVDPLNRESLRRMAFAHQRLGHLDSTVHYLRVSDSTLIADVTITQFSPEEKEATLRGTVTSLRPGTSAAFKLVFEFLNSKGEVVATQALDVPALESQGTHSIEAKVTVPGVAAWRYHKE